MFRHILWGMRVPIKVQCLWRVYPAPPPVILSPQRARDGTKIWGRISIPLSGNFRTHLAIRASVWDQRRLLKLLWQEQKWVCVKWIVGINAANYQLSKVITTILEVKYGAAILLIYHRVVVVAWLTMWLLPTHGSNPVINNF